MNIIIILTIKTRLMYIYLYSIYIYICNELIEETARRRKLIFWHVGVFWLWLQQVLSSDENVDSSWNYDVIVTFLLSNTVIRA